MSTNSPGYESDFSPGETLFESVQTNFSCQDGNFNLSYENCNNEANTSFETFDGDFSNDMYIILTPFLVTLGIFGNLLSIFVFYKSKLRLQSTSQYLSALAISDTLFLLQLLPPWLSTIGVNGLFYQNGFCQIFVYLSYVTCCFSSWLVIAFTGERFVVVQYPLRRNTFCTVRRARYVICILVAASLLVNIPILLFAGPGDNECNIDNEKLVHAARFNWVDTAIAFTIPLALIIIFNAWITVIVCKLGKERQRLVTEEQEPPPRIHRNRITRHVGYPQASQRLQHQITKMLIIVSTVFVVFNLPGYTMRVLAYAYTMDSSLLSETWVVAQHVSAILFNANFGINFFLYCLSGQNFRRALRQTVPCFAWLSRTSTATLNVITYHRGHGRSLNTSAGSNVTDNVTSNFVLSSHATNQQQRNRNDNFILRWSFNSRHRAPSPDRRVENIEMREMKPRRAISRPPPIDRGGI